MHCLLCLKPEKKSETWERCWIRMWGYKFERETKPWRLGVRVDRRRCQWSECWVRWDISQSFCNQLKPCLVNCNSNYIGIRIDITKNTRCCNVMLITIYLFGDNTIIEPWRQWNESILNQA